MPVYNGNSKIKELYYGGTKIKEAYYNGNKVYTSFTPQTIRFDYTGSVQTWTVPAGCTKLIVDCVGAAGGYVVNNNGGKGGRVQCAIQVTPNTLLYIYVGGRNTGYVTHEVTTYPGGYNGGGYGVGVNFYGDYIGGGPGGGASDIRIGGTDLINRKIVAGGGGGGAYSPGGGTAAAGANGGGTIGANGKTTYTSTPATGGTQSSGGAGATAGGNSGGAGSLGNGGGGAPLAGCGGGGGYYGGGGGFSYYASGAGGSSYTDPTLCTDVVHTQGYSAATGNGWIIITTSNQ